MIFRRSTFGGRVGGVQFGPGGISPFIKWMLIVNGGIFLLQVLWPALTPYLGLNSAVFFQQFPNFLYQIFTYMFLHGGIWHLFGNMWILWMFGTEVEFTWGTGRFAKFYLIGGLAGGFLTLVQYAIFPSAATLTIGASAAVWSVLITFWFMFPHRIVYLFPFPFPIRVKWLVPGLMALSFLLGKGQVAHMAHLGGALWGLAYMKSGWRWMRFGKGLKNLRHKRTEAKLEKRRQQAQDTMRRVDQILDKINEVGIDKLTPEERKFLEEASSELSDRKEQSENSR